jgi:hypothetical protein
VVDRTCPTTDTREGLPFLRPDEQQSTDVNLERLSSVASRDPSAPTQAVLAALRRSRNSPDPRVTARGERIHVRHVRWCEATALIVSLRSIRAWYARDPASIQHDDSVAARVVQTERRFVVEGVPET